MITNRQEKLLDFLIREYIGQAKPVSSKDLKRVCDLDVCGATIRNDLQALTESGYIDQPHTSSGRIPTKKAYKYFVEKIEDNKEGSFGMAQDKFFEDFILQEVVNARKKIEQEMKLAEELMRSLSEASMTLNYTRITKTNNLLEILEILGPSKTAHDENITIITKIIKQLENF